MFSAFDTDAMDSTEVRRLIERYFHHGFQNQVVVDCVNNRQAVTMNPSTLKRRLRDYGLSRRSAWTLAIVVTEQCGTSKD